MAGAGSAYCTDIATVGTGNGNFPGVFAINNRGEFIGTVVLNRREAERPGHVQPEGMELEVSYTFLPSQWANGYAFEAVSAVLDWAARALPDSTVVLCTQSANVSSMALATRLGFVEVERFEEFEAEQWFGKRDL